MIAALVVLGIVLVAFIYFVGIYNALVGLREGVKVAWANIDVLLKQRHDELPKLIDACKRYMQFEQDTLEKVMRARAAVFQASGTANIGALGTAEQQLRAGVGRLFAVAENYPELKADDSFIHLRARITGLEEAIADRRELYNEQVNINNIRIQIFPNSWIAGMYAFQPAHLLAFSADEKRDVDIGALFKS